MKPDLDVFWYWIKERHNIYKNSKVENKPKPWTEDNILQDYRFCNVYRELDTVTIWIRKNWREPYADNPNLWFAMCVARQINSVETLSLIGFPEGNLNKYIAKVKKILSKLQRNGTRIYGAAYILTGGGLSAKGLKKWQYTTERILTPIAKNCKIFSGKSKVALKEMQAELIQYTGFGAFIAYEVVSDLRWTRYYDGSDHNLWANPGPGAMRGLSRLFYGNENKGTKIKKDKMLELMQLLLLHSRSECKGMPSLEMREIEHSLCETDKYLRAKNNQGTPKQKYGGKP